MQGCPVLITAGGTVEPIDDVRAITNFSKGLALAEEAYARGLSVTFYIDSHRPRRAPRGRRSRPCHQRKQPGERALTSRRGVLERTRRHRLPRRSRR